jgi:hypothetical protein
LLPTLYIIWLSNLSILSVADEGYSRNAPWVDISAGGLLVLRGIIRPIVSSASALTWFIRYNVYMYYWNLQFLNNVIINKTKVLLPQVWVTLAVFGYHV